MNLSIGFSITWDSTCRCCGEKNVITARWNGSTFDMVQQDDASNPRLFFPCEKTGAKND